MKSRALAVELGKRLAALRDARGLRQDDVARAARQAGLPWTRVMVAALEAGRRDVTIDEYVRLPLLLEQLGGGRARASLTSDGDVADLNAGPLLTPMRQDLGTRWAEALAGIGRHERVRRAWPRATHADLEAAYEGAGGELEQKVGRRFRLDPLVVALAARAAWGHSLTAERDRRIAAEAPATATPRVLQALRGHVTRALLTELEPRLTEARHRVPRKKRGRR